MSESAAPSTTATQSVAPPKTSEGKRRPRTKAQREELKRAEERAREEAKRALDRETQRWNDCIECLENSVSKITENPWLIIHEPPFVHDYLDSLTETLSNILKHPNDIKRVRFVLLDVFNCFVNLGKFVKDQPAFYISNPHTIKRIARLLEQVAHQGSDKALFPNVLSLLIPTFRRESLFPLLYHNRIVSVLMSFARTNWSPKPHTLALLLMIFAQLSSDRKLQQMFVEDPGWPRFMDLVRGDIDEKNGGFTVTQQEEAKKCLHHFDRTSLAMTSITADGDGPPGGGSQAPADEVSSPKTQT